MLSLIQQNPSLLSSLRPQEQEQPQAVLQSLPSAGLPAMPSVPVQALSIPAMPFSGTPIGLLQQQLQPQTQQPQELSTSEETSKRKRPRQPYVKPIRIVRPKVFWQLSFSAEKTLLTYVLLLCCCSLPRAKEYSARE